MPPAVEVNEAVSAGDKSGQPSTRWQLVLAQPPGIFWCSKSFFSANHLTSWKMGHFSPPSPPLCCSLIGEEWERKGGGASFDRCGFVSLLHLLPVFFFFLSWLWCHTCHGREQSVCVFVGDCGQGVGAMAVLRAKDAVEKFSWRCWQEGPQERVCGTGRANPVPCSGISIGLGVATATVVELCVSHRLIPHEEGHTDRCYPQAWSLFWPGNEGKEKQ